MGNARRRPRNHPRGFRRGHNVEKGEGRSKGPHVLGNPDGADFSWNASEGLEYPYEEGLSANMMTPLAPGTLQKAASGHEREATALVNFIYANARFISRASPSDVDDLTQKVFMKAIIAFREGKFDPAKGEAAWITTIVRHTFLTMQRDAGRHRTAFGLDHDAEERDAPDEVDAEGGLHERERREAVEAALDELDADDRTLLALKFDQELTNAKIASVLKIPENTVKSRVHRLIERLKLAVEDRKPSTSQVIEFTSARRARRR